MPAISSDGKRRRRWNLLVALALSLPVGQAVAGGEAALAQHSGCFSCHRGAAQWIGPAYKDVAARYAGTPDAVTVLARRIVAGTGPAGMGWMADGKARLPSMSSNSVSPEDARRLAAWILDIRSEVVEVGRFVSGGVAISSPATNAIELAADDLRRLPLREMSLTMRSGAQTTFKGALLRDVLTTAGVDNGSPFDARKSVIVATASDGWRVVFSWAEIFETSVGDSVLVFLEKDGKALGDDEGRIALVSGGDSHAETRYLKWLRKIEVRRISD